MREALAYGPQILAGLVNTILLTLCTIPFAAMLGLVLTSMSLARVPLLRAAAQLYTVVFRSLPELIILLFFYYGLSATVSFYIGRGVEFSSFATSVAALSMICGAYVGEVLRGAVQAVATGQKEAALALGLRPLLVWIKIVVPQAVRIAIPPLGSVFLILLKDTALASVIGTEEVMRKSSMAAGSTRSPFLFFGIASICYLIISVPILVWQGRLERLTGVSR